MEEPEIYIRNEYEYRKGFKYKQPIEYCNNIVITYDVIKNFYEIFGKPFKQVQKESKAYNDSLKDCMFYSEYWNNEKAKIKAFNKIHDFNINHKSNTGSSTTPLMPFEIYLLNDGFEMMSFCEMNALDPALSIVCEKQIGNNLINPLGVIYKRLYKKLDYTIRLGFGIEKNKVFTKFYFETNKSNSVFQVDNDINNYYNAINGKLKPL